MDECSFFIKKIGPQLSGKDKGMLNISWSKKQPIIFENKYVNVMLMSLPGTVLLMTNL